MHSPGGVTTTRRRLRAQLDDAVAVGAAVLDGVIAEQSQRLDHCPQQFGNGVHPLVVEAAHPRGMAHADGGPGLRFAQTRRMSPVSEWSIRVQAERSEIAELSSQHALLRSELRSAVFALNPEDPEGPCTITVELRATSADHARVLTQHMLGEMRRAAGLSLVQMPVLWVAPLNDHPVSSHRFLAQAKDLFESEDYDLAVVAAQIHVETHMATLLRMLVEADPSPVAEALLSSRVEWTLMQSWQRDLLDALIGRPIAKSFPGWKAYGVHVQRRNAIVHGGQVVDRRAAADSLAAAQAMWEWINAAALAALAGARGVQADQGDPTGQDATEGNRGAVAATASHRALP